MVSSDFGKLEVRRHLISGDDCAIAGAATSVVAPATAPAVRNVRRFIVLTPLKPWLDGLSALRNPSISRLADVMGFARAQPILHAILREALSGPLDCDQCRTTILPR